MFDRTSRYSEVETGELQRVAQDGSTITLRYKRRRPIPRPETHLLLAEHVVVDGDRLDNIAARYTGDPTQFWRLCDANGVFHPDDLVAEPGTIVRMAVAGR